MATESETELTTDAIRFTGVHKLFRTAEQATLALRHLTFAVARGEYVCVLGRSGCGKSTTVNLLLGLGEFRRGWPFSLMMVTWPRLIWISIGNSMVIMPGIPPAWQSCLP